MYLHYSTSDTDVGGVYVVCVHAYMCPHFRSLCPMFVFVSLSLHTYSLSLFIPPLLIQTEWLFFCYWLFSWFVLVLKVRDACVCGFVDLGWGGLVCVGG